LQAEALKGDCSEVESDVLALRSHGLNLSLEGVSARSDSLGLVARWMPEFVYVSADAFEGKPHAVAALLHEFAVACERLGAQTIATDIGSPALLRSLQGSAVLALRGPAVSRAVRLRSGFSTDPATDDDFGGTVTGVRHLMG